MNRRQEEKSRLAPWMLKKGWGNMSKSGHMVDIGDFGHRRGWISRLTRYISILDQKYTETTQ